MKVQKGAARADTAGVCGVANAVYEFLRWVDMERCVPAFVSDCQDNAIRIQPRDAVTAARKWASVADALLESFDSGKWEQFFRWWNDVYSKDDAEESAKLLNFYLNICCVTEPLRKGEPTREEGAAVLDELREYLDEEADASLSSQPTIAPFYSLRQARKPKQTTAFRDLSQEKFAKQVRDRLVHFLKLRGRAPLPVLLRMWNSMENDQSAGSATEDHPKVKTDEPIQFYRQRYIHLQKDYHKLIGIAAELVNALEQSVQGMPITAEYVQDISSRLLESNQEAQGHMSSTPQAPAAAAAVTKARPKQTAPTVTFAPTSRDESPAESKPKSLTNLNFDRMRQQLVRQPCSDESNRLVGALRHILYRRVDLRSEVMQKLAHADLLHLKARKGSDSVVAVVLQGDGAESKELMCRLLNAIASTKAGRNYLTSSNQGRDFVLAVVGAVKAKRVDGAALDHAMATLQKLSLRRSTQGDLIRAVFVEWLVQHLSANQAQISDYALEYTTALLMNLTLNSAGKQACLRCVEPLVKLMASLTQHRNKEIHSYVNGILFSTLSLSRIRKKARDIVEESAAKVRARGESEAVERARLADLERLDDHFPNRGVVTAVAPDIYISGVEGALDFSQLDEHLISHVLSVRQSAIAPAHRHPACVYEFVYLRDEVAHADGELLRSGKLERCLDFMDAALRLKNGRVLVHCQYGYSRSAAVIVGYLMRKRGAAATDVVEWIWSNMHKVSPNPFFMKQLAVFQEMGYRVEKESLEFHRYSYMVLKRPQLSAPTLDAAPADCADAARAVYKCVACRTPLFAERHRLRHERGARLILPAEAAGGDGRDECARHLLLLPMDWHWKPRSNQYMPSYGALHCPSCGRRVGLYKHGEMECDALDCSARIFPWFMIEAAAVARLLLPRAIP